MVRDFSLGFSFRLYFLVSGIGFMVRDFSLGFSFKVRFFSSAV